MSRQWRVVPSALLSQGEMVQDYERTAVAPDGSYADHVIKEEPLSPELHQPEDYASSGIHEGESIGANGASQISDGNPNAAVPLPADGSSSRALLTGMVTSLQHHSQRKEELLTHMVALMGEMLEESRHRRVLEAERRDIENKRLAIETEHLKAVKQQTVVFREGFQLLSEMLKSKTTDMNTDK